MRQRLLGLVHHWAMDFTGEAQLNLTGEGRDMMISHSNLILTVF